MKKALIALFCVLGSGLYAQNVQLHYDLGNGRKYFTSTLEMFKPDKWGNTFFFVDFNYSLDNSRNVSLAYMEIARCISLGKSPFSAHVEFDGGMLASGSMAYPINNAYLAGLDYGWHTADFSKTLNLKLLYKNISAKTSASFQITGVWNLNFFNKKLTLSGFADFWKEKNLNFTKGNGDALSLPAVTDFVFLSEPQFWYNATEHLSLGSEVELGCNFGTVKGLKVCPTLAAKWNF